MLYLDSKAGVGVTMPVLTHASLAKCAVSQQCEAASQSAQDGAVFATCNSRLRLPQIAQTCSDVQLQKAYEQALEASPQSEVPTLTT